MSFLHIATGGEASCVTEMCNCHLTDRKTCWSGSDPSAPFAGSSIVKAEELCALYRCDNRLHMTLADRRRRGSGMSEMEE